jgi:large subunit ribosomal protein L23
MKSLNRVVHRPVVTERTTTFREKGNKYVFAVDPRANKMEIKRAVESMFDVRVTAVRTANVLGKLRVMHTRRGLSSGRRPTWKKAIVTLAEGQTIDIFDVV